MCRFHPPCPPIYMKTLPSFFKFKFYFFIRNLWKNTVSEHRNRHQICDEFAQNRLYPFLPVYVGNISDFSLWVKLVLHFFSSYKWPKNHVYGILKFILHQAFSIWSPLKEKKPNRCLYGSNICPKDVKYTKNVSRERPFLEIFLLFSTVFTPLKWPT